MTSTTLILTDIPRSPFAQQWINWWKSDANLFNEIIMIDDDGADSAYKIIEQYAMLTIISKQFHQPLQKVLNDIVANIDTDYIMIADPNIMLTETKLDHALTYFDDQSCGIVSAAVWGPNNATYRESAITGGIRAGWLWTNEERTGAKFDQNLEGSPMLAPTEFLFIIRNTTWQKVAGVNPLLSSRRWALGLGVAVDRMGERVLHTQHLQARRLEDVESDPKIFGDIIKQNDMISRYLIVWTSGTSVWGWMSHGLLVICRLACLQLSHTRAIAKALWALLH